MTNTIVSIATPPIKSALGIIRVSGSDSFDIVSLVFTADLRGVDKRTSFVGEIKDDDKVIDQVVLLAYKSPKSFTGEDMVEIICHGSVLIENQIISLLLSKGARLATNGEYSQRAFVNGKVDLVQAEAINDVINAISDEAKSLSMMSLKGETSNLLVPIKKELADILSLIEVNIDFPEYEDIEVANKEKILSSISPIVSKIDTLINDGEKGILIKEGIKVSIVGKPNVGKSSLLNSLLKEDKAIVTNIPGTTRDIVEGDVNIDGLILHLMDTAGIRDTIDAVESLGINKSLESINKSDLVIVVLDGSKPIDGEDELILEKTKNHKRIVVYNKSDLFVNDVKGIKISCVNGDISNLINEIKNVFGLDESVFIKPSLANDRQIALLKRAKGALIKADDDCRNDISIDLISVSLFDAFNCLKEILGEDNSLDFTKEIFSRFCVGK